VAAYLRTWQDQRLFCIFNFSSNTQLINWQWVKHHGPVPEKMKDHWTGQTIEVGGDDAQMILEPYAFLLLEPV
jgi:amylosucrase